MLEGEKEENTAERQKPVQKLDSSTFQRQMYHIKYEITGNYT